MQFIILGMHRSGTSSVTRLVNMMGAYVGEATDLVAANEENPKGFFERYDVIDINNRILQANDSHWFYLDSVDMPKRDDAIDDAIKTVTDSLNQHEHCVMKDPRMCNTLSAWMPHLDNPFLIIVHRDPAEIASSLNKRNGFSVEHGLALWEYAAISMLKAAQTTPHHIISYADLMRDPVTTTKNLYDAIAKHADGLNLPADDDITAFIDPSLYRSKNQGMSLKDKQQALAHIFESGDLSGTPAEPSDEARAAMEEVAHFLPTLVEREAVKEKLGHAEATVQEQRERIEELMKERDAFESRMKLVQSDNDAKAKRMQEMADQQQELEEAKLERDIIKQSRWWKLRSLLLLKGGVTLKEVIIRPK